MKVDWAIEDEQLLLKMNAANRIADWIAIRSLAVEFYGYSRIDQRLGDRKDSYANFERELGFARRDGIRLLESDKIFHDTFARRINEKEKYGFFNPNYFDWKS